jgi:hypothetical protein
MQLILRSISDDIGRKTYQQYLGKKQQDAETKAPAYSRDAKVSLQAHPIVCRHSLIGLKYFVCLILEN